MLESSVRFGRPGSALSSASSSNRAAAIDVQGIASVVNDAQRQGTRGQVQPLPNGALADSVRLGNYGRQMGSQMSVMAPPPVPPGRGHVVPYYLTVAVPGRSLDTSFGNYGGAPLPPAIGYTSAHQHHQTERHRWSKMSYAKVAGETISLHIQVLYEVLGKSRGNLVDNIHEGFRDIDADITPHQIRVLVFDKIVPKLVEARPGFKFHWDSLTIRETGNACWIDLGLHPQDIPYFYNRCWANSTTKGVQKKVFKPPAKGFQIALVIDAPQWKRCEMFVADQELAAEEREEQLRAVDSTGAGRENSTWDVVLMSHRERERFQQQRKQPESFSTSQSTRPSTPPKKRPLEPGSPGTVSLTPPSKRTSQVEFHSPDTNRLLAALSGQENALVDMPKLLDPSENIQMIFIPSRVLSDLLDGSASPVVDLSSAPTHGFLTTHLSQRLGIGAFKTAYAGRLTLTPLSSTGLGKYLNDPVVVKRPYRQVKTDSGALADQAVHRHTTQDELKKLIHEANTFMWAYSIMDMTYSFIDTYSGKQSSPPPFTIPRLRFVYAGLAVFHGAIMKGSITTTQQKACLVEELIDELYEGEFIKYIHNADPVPLTETSEYGYETAQFLAFTQHVQYWKTKGLVYISDYQGGRSLLTDPQVMTDPKVAQGRDIFGDGNVAQAVLEFPSKHVCNAYCK